MSFGGLRLPGRAREGGDILKVSGTDHNGQLLHTWDYISDTHESTVASILSHRSPLTGCLRPYSLYHSPPLHHRSHS